MILDLDVGNSRVKWRVSDPNGNLVDRGAISRTRQHWIESLKVVAISRVRISNVAGETVKQQLQIHCDEQWGIVPEFAVTAPEAIGVRNGYADPQRLGVDRWLALLAAFDRSDSGCSIVDCGSAITVDYVSVDGTHKGGVIAPGIELMRKALLTDTQEIIVHTIPAGIDQQIPAADTTDGAVELGLRYMEAGLVEIRCNRFENFFGQTTALFLTGGDAEKISKLIVRDHLVAPDLVLGGLALALP